MTWGWTGEREVAGGVVACISCHKLSCVGRAYACSSSTHRLALLILRPFRWPRTALAVRVLLPHRCARGRARCLRASRGPPRWASRWGSCWASAHCCRWGNRVIERQWRPWPSNVEAYSCSPSPVSRPPSLAFPALPTSHRPTPQTAISFRRAILMKQLADVCDELRSKANTHARGRGFDGVMRRLQLHIKLRRLVEQLDLKPEQLKLRHSNTHDPDQEQQRLLEEGSTRGGAGVGRQGSRQGSRVGAGGEAGKEGGKEWVARLMVGAGGLEISEEQVLMNRALGTSISLVVFFFGVLMSTAVIQIYVVGVEKGGAVGCGVGWDEEGAVGWTARQCKGGGAHGLCQLGRGVRGDSVQSRVMDGALGAMAGAVGWVVLLRCCERGCRAWTRTPAPLASHLQLLSSEWQNLVGAIPGTITAFGIVKIRHRHVLYIVSHSPHPSLGTAPLSRTSPQVGVLLSVVLAVLTHPWTWSYFLPAYWLYIVAIAAVFLLNKVRNLGT